MIYVRLVGGLGNQMFQYAAGRRLALFRKTDITLDISYYDHQPANDVPRTFELECFDLPIKLAHKRIVSSDEAKPLVKIGISVNSALIEEKSFAFMPEVLSASDNSTLTGYWQSEKYFIDQEKQIRQDFTFVAPLSKHKRTIADEISRVKGSAVAIQIRRGDYASHPVSSQFHGLLPFDYYKKAVKEISHSTLSPTFFVISDDPEWCKTNFKINYPTIFCGQSPGGWEDMNLMSKCDHHIIANSSFGWWAAWLGTNPNKKVIAPKKWFKGAKLDTSDLIPRGWIRL